MPEFPLFDAGWGNVAFHDAVDDGDKTIVTAIACDTRARGDLKDIMQTIKDSKSAEHFSELCVLRGLTKKNA